MIIISATTHIEAYKNALQKLYNTSLTPNDEEIYKEDSLVLEIDNVESSSRINFDGKSLSSKYNYDSIFVNGNVKALEEFLYWKQELIDSHRLSEIIQYMKDYPTSKRSIILTWSDEQRNLDLKGSCVTYVFFRIINNRLDMHAHMRANDAYNCLLLDIDILRIIQVYICEHLNVTVGSYIHIVDSLHIYMKDKEIVDKLFID